MAKALMLIITIVCIAYIVYNSLKINQSLIFSLL